MIKIGILIKSYAIDRPYDWERRKLEPISRPSAYRVEELVTFFLIYDDRDSAYKLVYKKINYTFEECNKLKNLNSGLYILSLNEDMTQVRQYSSLSNLIDAKKELVFEDKVYYLSENNYSNYSLSRSIYSRNCEILAQNESKRQFSVVESNWVEYVREVSIYESFARDLPKLFREYVDEYKKNRTELSKYDIVEILKDLSIEIYEVFRNKVGGDDSYFVHEVRTVSYDENKLDKYLIDYLKLGNREIHRDSGYTSAYNMAIPNLKTGVWADEDVASIKEELVNNYSLENHIYSVISRRLNHYTNVARIPSRHRYSDGITAYLFSNGFISDLEKVMGGGTYIREWENFEEHIKNINSKLTGLTWNK